MKTIIFMTCIFFSQAMLGFSDTNVWFVIENQTGYELTYEMEIAANTAQGLQFTNTTLNPKTFIHVDPSDTEHIVLVQIKFTIPKQQTVVYYPVFFIEDRPVFPTVYQVHVELGKKKKRYTFPVHESTCRYIKVGLDVVDDVELIRTQIPLHTYAYQTLSYQWQSLLLGIQSLNEKKEEEA